MFCHDQEAASSEVFVELVLRGMSRNRAIRYVGECLDRRMQSIEGGQSRNLEWFDYRGAGRGWAVWCLKQPATMSKFCVPVAEITTLEGFWEDEALSAVDLYLKPFHAFKDRVISSAWDRLRRSLSSAFLSPGMREAVAQVNGERIVARWPTRKEMVIEFSTEFPKILTG